MKTGPLQAENTGGEISEVTRDHMPASVATDLLCTQKRITNKERKTYQAARCTVFESTLKPLPIEEQLNRRLQKASWSQLAKWNKRCVARRADAQRAYLLAERRKNSLSERLRVVEPKKENGQESVMLQIAVMQFERLMSACALKAEQLDLFRDAIEQETERRKENFKPAAECPGENPGTGCNYPH